MLGTKLGCQSGHELLVRHPAKLHAILASKFLERHGFGAMQRAILARHVVPEVEQVEARLAITMLQPKQVLDELRSI